MRRVLVLVAATVSLTACGEWRGDGSDEVIPDVIGQATGIKPSFGVLSQTHADHADLDIRENRPPEAEVEEGEAEGHSAPHPAAKHEAGVKHESGAKHE